MFSFTKRGSKQSEHPPEAELGLRTIQRILSRNKKIFLQYNNFRKRLFQELAPKDSQLILCWLPWLLSVNHPRCPGYIPDLDYPFRIVNRDDPDMAVLEAGLTKCINLADNNIPDTSHGSGLPIEGLYTIGSIGSVSQNTDSDCDIWICVDADRFDQQAWARLEQKVNLIKDWLDQRLQLPVYFFISDIAAIRACSFGALDQESSGSTQQKVLKEEFYRTCLVIAGKIPIWWLCYHPSTAIDYQRAVEATEAEDFWEYDLIDLGDIDHIAGQEYFGAVLWQFHKSLKAPLKSIIKMSLLQVLFEAPEEGLLCHQFRRRVFSVQEGDAYPDFSVFAMMHLLQNRQMAKDQWRDFLVECFYLRCRLNPYDRMQKLKNKLAHEFLKNCAITREQQALLREADTWNVEQQIELGDKLFDMLLSLYRDFAAKHAGILSESDQRELTVLGRKISSHYLKKKYKVPVLQKPTGRLNVGKLVLMLDTDGWRTFSRSHVSSPLHPNRNLVFNMAFMVWNGLFDTYPVHMRPNPSHITAQEITNLGKRIGQFIGTYETLDIPHSRYLQAEQVIKLLLVIGATNSPWYRRRVELNVIYLNGWGELFCRQFPSMETYEAFVADVRESNAAVESSTYMLRSTTAFEKIIERAKRRLAP